MPDDITGAHYLAAALKQIGVSDVFFIDAVLRKTLIELEDQGIGRVLVHSEKAAAYMADGYARMSGRVGVCMAQSVGAANLAAGLQDGFLHRAPILALTGRKPPGFRYRNAYQEIDHAPLYAPVTKLHADVALIEELPLLLAQALRTAISGSPRPVHLDLDGLQGEIIENGRLDAPPLPDAALGRLPKLRPRAPAEQIEAAARALRGAQRPVLVVGTGAVQAEAHDAVRTLAEGFALPVATSLGGRGILPTTHPRHIGVVGTYSAPPTNELVHRADLVVFLGSHTGDQTTNNWTVPPPVRAIIQIDRDATEIGRNYPGVVGVEGCPRQALLDLFDALGDHTPWRDWAEEAAAHYADWHASMAPLRRSDATPIRVERLCHEISEALPENGVLVADTGYSGIWTGTMVELEHPSQRYLRAAGSLGWAFPAALGAKVGGPDRPVLCFSGDGAFYYHLGELETARRRGIPVVTVINNNSAFGQGLPKVRALYGNRPGDPDEIIRFGPTNFAEVAKSFGVEGIRVEEPDAIRPALEKALSMNAPVVLDVVTDALPRAPEPWNPPA